MNKLKICQTTIRFTELTLHEVVILPDRYIGLIPVQEVVILPKTPIWGGSNGISDCTNCTVIICQTTIRFTELTLQEVVILPISVSDCTNWLILSSCQTTIRFTELTLHEVVLSDCTNWLILSSCQGVSMKIGMGCCHHLSDNHQLPYMLLSLTKLAHTVIICQTTIRFTELTLQTIAYLHYTN